MMRSNGLDEIIKISSDSEEASCIVRNGNLEDCKAIAELLTATYTDETETYYQPNVHSYDLRQGRGHKCTGDVVTALSEKLASDGFSGEAPKYRCIVAESGNPADNLLAFSLFSFTFSTWEGRVLYIQELVVAKDYRHRGIGRLVAKKLAEIAKQSRCNRIHWLLKNNDIDGMHFSKTINGRDMTSCEQWHQYRLCNSEFDRFA